jgi:hypothetical protein
MPSPNEKRTKRRALTADLQIPYLGFGKYLIGSDDAAAVSLEAHVGDPMTLQHHKEA